MPVEIISTVGADGGRDYATLGLWFSGRGAIHTDLVTDDNIETAECYDDGDDVGPTGAAQLVLSGWTTDSTRYPKIIAAEGHVHDGTNRTQDATGNGAWVSGPNVSAVEIVRIQQANTHIEKMRFHDSGNNKATVRLIPVGGISADGCRFSKCMFHGTSGNNSAFAVTQSFTSLDDTIISECIAGSKGAGFSNSSGASGGGTPVTNLKYINCIVFDCNNSYFVGAVINDITADITNCISINPNVRHLRTSEQFGGTVTLTGTNNISDDSGGATLPNDDGSSFEDAAAVVQGTDPFGAGNKVIFKSDNFTTNNDPRPSHLGRNVIRRNGKILSFMDDTVDLDGTKRSDTVRHIGPFVPVRRNVNVT